MPFDTWVHLIGNGVGDVFDGMYQTNPAPLSCSVTTNRPASPLITRSAVGDHEMTSVDVDTELDELSADVYPSSGEDMSLSVVIPCLNEQANITAVYLEVIEELAQYEPLEVLFVDDGSTDGTLGVIKDLAH